jgi:hypothetical protein
MEIEGKEVSVENVEVFLNKKLMLTIMVVAGLSVILAGFLSFVFSDSLWTLLLSLVFAITLGLLINYFLIVSSKIITRVDVNLKLEEKSEDLHSVMKME